MCADVAPKGTNFEDACSQFGAIEPFFRLLPKTTRQVLAKLWGASGITATELAHGRNVTVSAIRPQLARLEQVGLVQHHTEDSTRAGRPLHRYELSSVGRTLLSASPLVWATAAELSARAQELATAATEMKAQAAAMNDAVGWFKLDGGDA